MDGIITFNNKYELLDILSNLNSDEYEQRQNAVEENYKRVESFSNIETYLFNNYYQLISEFED